MEKNRHGIAKQVAPTIVLPLKIFNVEVGEKAFADCELEIVGQRLEDDGNGNDVMKYVLKVIEIKRHVDHKARA